MISRIAVIGLGLMGGSLALALKRAWPGLEVIGYARRPELAARALELGAVDRGELKLASAVEGAEVVIIAVPVLTVQEVLRELASLLSPGCIVTDTASTKARVMSWAEEYLPATASFIGGHPMTGKELAGIEAAEAGLFQGCTYCLCPASSATPEAVQQMTELVEVVGARPILIEPDQHDRLVAGISHLPALISVALVAATSQSPSWPDMARLASTGYRDLTRLASSSPRMNRDILLTNQAAIFHWLGEFIRELNELRRLIAESGEGLEEALARAQAARQAWLAGRGAGLESR